MIPIKIQIKNFLSYGSDIQTVDFSPYHLLCLSGKNGHGKSALLDAVTWAIWGQARKTSNTAKADHGLLRLGQTHMLVILDFECNNTHYRIRREFALTYGKPYSALDFGIVDATQDTIAPLTEKTIRGTQQKIEDTLHLDYEAFINSAFLRQGQSNEFSKKSAKERKEVLANILGLQRYEHMRKFANDASREAAIEKQQITALQTNIAQELEKTEEIQSSLRLTEEQLELHAQQEAGLKTALMTLQKERDLLMQQQIAKQQIEKEIADLSQTQKQNEQELRVSLKEWRTVQAQQLHTQSPEQLKEEHAALTQTLAVHQETLAKKLEKKDLYLKEKEIMTQVTHAIKMKQQEIVHHALLKLQQTRMILTQQEQQKTGLETRRLQIQTTLKNAEQEIKELENNIATFPAEQLTACEKQFEKRKTFYQQWIAQANMLKNELDQLNQKKQFAHEEDDSTACPLCEQNLSAARKKFLKSKLAKDESTLIHRYNRLSRYIKKTKNLLYEQHEQLSALKKKQTEIQITVHKKQEAEKKRELLHNESAADLKELERIEQLITVTRQTVLEQEKNHVALQKSVDQCLAEAPEYQKQSAILHQHELQYNAITYDAQSHQLCTQKLQEITAKLNSYEKLQTEILKQQERQRIIHHACAKLKEIKQNLHALQTKLVGFAALDASLSQHTTKEKDLQKKYEESNAEKEKLLQQKGKYTQHLALLAKSKEAYAKYSERIKELNETIEDYQTLATALGKNGIQALLIEDTIPEIEQEANDLLSRLTDNQAHIFIESLRDLKSGGTAETLDIKISDAAGIRPYELFSGGEAFRIDFALRIAISKLLARRAGTSLQTLIIDEGFGSQDDDGLSYIMDAIYKIQEDFKKVIIVSHLPKMKDQFPVHFYVQKTPSGSTVRIIEQA